MVRQAGFSVLLAIVALMLTGVAMMMVLDAVNHDIGQLRLEERSSQLVALTDAALAETLAGLAADPAFSGVGRRALGAGQIASSVAAGSDGAVTVRSRAWFGGWRGELTAEVNLASDVPGVVRWSRSTAPSDR
jgi:hypothetical protein